MGDKKADSGKERVFKIARELSERRKPGYDRRKSEQMFKIILSGSPIPAFVIGTNHRVIYWNRALEELSGIKAEEVIGTDGYWKAFYKEERPCMADLLVDDRIEEIAGWYEEGYAKSQLIDEAYEATDFFPALGEKGRWLRFTAAILRDSDGKIVGAIETLEDITDRKIAEAAQKESEQKLNAILEGSPIPAFVIGTDHRIIYWNRALEELSGIKARDMIGTNRQWMAFYDKNRPCMADLLIDGHEEEILTWYSEKYKKLKFLGEAYEATDFFPALGKRGRWLRFTAALLRLSEGTPVGAIETLEDITEQKCAEGALIESEQLLRVVIGGSPIPTFVIGNDHRLIYWNQALEELSGIKADDVIGTKKHWMAFYNQERPCMADLLVDGRLHEVPAWYKDNYMESRLIPDAYEATDFFPALGSNGKWLRFTAATLRSSTGLIMGAVETLEDITDRKRAEEALIESEQRFKRLSITDTLTSLFNSRHFYHQLRSEIERANRYNHPLSMLLLDIDNFKDYNDTYGHLEGDSVLIRLGEVILRCLRKTDSAYRFGGEEFTALLPETKGEAAVVLAERIRHEFEHEDFTPRDETPVHRTVSIGVAQYLKGEELTTFLKRVDENMYVAKREGKNRVLFREE
ncbi:MAG: diguanylate cyclase [Deltaproteobacteria bacterium]|nr:diguanylate cyclase [Deltaproteobacteria bacterium]